jgi:hypothetical protein
VNIKHAKTLPLVFVQVLVVHLVRPPDGTDIGIVASGKPFEPLVDDHIMDNEISKPISHDAKANGMQPPKTRRLHTVHDAQHAGNGKNHKKGIIFLEKARLYLMMVLVKIPEKTMHDPTVGAPSNGFHQQKNTQNNQKIQNGYHVRKVKAMYG